MTPKKIFDKWLLLTFLSCFLVVSLTACDTSNPAPEVEPPPDPIELLPVSDSVVELSNGRLSVVLTESGGLNWLRIDLDDSTPAPARYFSIGSSVGLWLAGLQNGIKSNVGSDMLTLILDKFELQGQNLDGYGFYKVEREDFELGFVSWPFDFGAPTHPDGSPKMWGDDMVWGVFGGITTSSNSFSDITVVKTAYVFDNDVLKNTLFVRYEVSNRSSVPIEDLHIGFGADMDLHWPGFLSATQSCGLQNPGWNY